MFNQKKVLRLEKELEDEREKNRLLNIRLQDDLKQIKIITSEIRQKVIPTPTKVNSQDAIALAKSLQRFTKQRKCGGGGCGEYYLIPCSEIDKIVPRLNTPSNIASKYPFLNSKRPNFPR